MFRKFRVKIDSKSYPVEFEKYENLGKFDDNRKEYLKS